MKLKIREKRALGLVFALIYFSGAALFVFCRFVRVASAIGEQHHPAEQWVRVSHSSLTYAVLLGLGYLLKGHVLPGLRARKRLKSGLAVLSLFGVLCVTAIGILYTGEGALNTIAIQLHQWIGLSIPLLIAAHVLGVRRAKPTARAPGRRASWKRARATAS